MHLTQTTRSFIFTCDSCSVRVKQTVPALFLHPSTDRVLASASAGALKSPISQEVLEQVPHVVLGLSDAVPCDHFEAL